MSNDHLGLVIWVALVQVGLGSEALCSHPLHVELGAAALGADTSLIQARRASPVGVFTGHLIRFSSCLVSASNQALPGCHTE